MSDPVWNDFRRWGYLQADLDPLGRLPPVPVPELEADEPKARRIYCGTLAVEFMHIADPERRAWVIEAMEAEAEPPDRVWIAEKLARAELFETGIQKRYIGTRRYSLEGLGAVIPFLGELIEATAESGVDEIVMGTAHRGRLNIIVNIVGRSPVDVFAQFEDVDPRSVLGGGDVKYHLGADGAYTLRDGRKISVSMVSNPSHLEHVNPVVLGKTRARQKRRGRTRVACVTLHGEAAFAGQGIAAESLNLADLPGYTVGGTVHVVLNNLIGFTTPPESLHSSRFATDVAKRLPIPIFHVNAEDPDAVVRAARIAAEFRATFATDVVVDIIGYRRWGHSEIDDPSLTQPQLYAQIDRRPPLWLTYAESHGIDAESMRRRIQEEFDTAHEIARSATERPALSVMPDYWKRFQNPIGGEVPTSIAHPPELERPPEGFKLHPKIVKGLEQRVRMARGEIPVDWATAEAWALASLAREGIPVRLTGEDTRRGTFNQRHAVLFDVNTGQEFLTLPIECIDSPLSEAAVLGFEYGFSRDYPEALVAWEAQFGDFANVAQVIIDQFLSAAEEKWGLSSGLVLLLPHGYEGQGPEHSSARIERFLQLAAQDNIQICQPSTSAQYFHLLRRQALAPWRKPLVVFTPKSLLRDPAAHSPLSDFTSGAFRPVLDEPQAQRILVGTGKIVHLLRRERERRKDAKTSIVAVDQLYPFPEDRIRLQAEEIVWVQEEPANMGALGFVQPILERLTGRSIRSVKRTRSASPATGSMKASQIEEAALLDLAFWTPS